MRPRVRIALQLCWDDGVVLRDGSRGEIVIPRGDDDVRIVDRGRRREVDGVVATQRMALGELSGSSCKRVVEPDHIQLVAQGFDRPDCSPQRARVDAAAAMRGGSGSTCFGVDELTGGDDLCPVPQLDGDV
jgi:hypothetical protein